ncbi:hypothetical protein [Shewanella sedimentimangrovi]|uniref:Uncharacterized protein n=1 Tax=Shewanella sedimentimangrovi TaxID=2814293 RepID=A0ABX7QYC3_9GAMM|nr:hypothetical protein [Shewanella sedimentimangrovi]QSX35980.1 hypothetical protein JYB85_11530 [Shewanella sedimentimangrovi]
MWNWFTKMLGIRPQPQRKRVQVEIPMELHEYRAEIQRQPINNGPKPDNEGS